MICLSLLFLLITTMSDRAVAVPPDGSPCDVGADPDLVGAIAGVMVGGICKPVSAAYPAGRLRPTEVVDCGRPNDFQNGTNTWNVKLCGPTPKLCRLVDPAVPGPGVVVDTEATILTAPDPAENQVLSVWCPEIRDLITAAAVREQAIRLLPTVPVGTTVGTTGTYTLVNVQTIFWAPTTKVRDLGTVTVAGIPVQLRATLTHATWNFGNDTTDTTTTPGKAYVPHSCNDPVCPGYYSHTYKQDGTKTATLTITWDVEYNPNNTGWQPVATLNGPPATANILVYGTRAILAAPPS